MTLFSDGSVRFIADSISQKTWFQLHSRDDGSPMASDFQ